MKRCGTCGRADEHAEWCPGRRVRGRAVRASYAQPNRVTHARIFEDHPDRSWSPEEKATDKAMNAVLEILMRRGQAYQNDIADELAAVLGVPLGTARANTSAALLCFREAGWVRVVAGEDRRQVAWELDA